MAVLPTLLPVRHASRENTNPPLAMLFVLTVLLGLTCWNQPLLILIFLRALSAARVTLAWPAPLGLITSTAASAMPGMAVPPTLKHV